MGLADFKYGLDIKNSPRSDLWESEAFVSQCVWILQEFLRLNDPMVADHRDELLKRFLDQLEMPGTISEKVPSSRKLSFLLKEAHREVAKNFNPGWLNSAQED